MLVFLGWKPREREGGEFRWRSKLRRGVLLPKGLTRRGEGRGAGFPARKKRKKKEGGQDREEGWTLGSNEQKERLIPTCYPEEEPLEARSSGIVSSSSLLSSLSLSLTCN